MARDTCSNLQTRFEQLADVLKFNESFCHNFFFFFFLDGKTKSIFLSMTIPTQEPKSLYLPKKRLEVTSSAIVVLTAFLDSPNLPKEGLSGLKGNFSWRDT